MSDEESSLFDLDDSAPQPPVDPPIRADQVQQIEQAFAQAGITNRADQLDLVYSCTIRQIRRLEDLLARDARGILKRIAEIRPGLPPQGSAWDNRLEDTWIDKL